MADRKKKLRQEALHHLREARRRIDPELLAETRRLIAEKAEEDQASRRGKPASIAVDRKKNMTTIMKFLELKAADKAFCRRVQSIFSE